MGIATQLVMAREHLVQVRPVAFSFKLFLFELSDRLRPACFIRAILLKKAS
jgi:hypothetical protein